MEEFYEYLRKIGIIDPPDVFDVVGRMSTKKAVKTLIDCYFLVSTAKFKTVKSKTIFDFSVGSTLSGGIKPCVCIDCRMNNVYKLSIFASMYADTVLISNPFDYATHFLESRNIKNVRLFYERLMGDILVLLNFKPLIECGIVVINTPHVLCEECFNKYITSQKEVEGRMESMRNELEKIIFEKIKFRFEKPRSIILESKDDYIRDYSLTFLRLPKQFKKYVKLAPHIFSLKEIENLNILGKLHFLDYYFSDLLIQKYSQDALGLTYLTDIPFEIDIIKKMSLGNNTWGRNITDDLSHYIPLCYGVRVEDVINLRKNENQAFSVYRDAVKKAIETVKLDKTASSSKIIDDMINPELNKIDRIIDINRKYFKREIKKKLFNSACLSIGAMGSDFLGLDVSTLFKTFAAAYGAKNIADDFWSAKKIPQEALGNDYYFLWKLRKKR